MQTFMLQEDLRLLAAAYEVKASSLWVIEGLCALRFALPLAAE
jgi:hypothetical protein